MSPTTVRWLRRLALYGTIVAVCLLVFFPVYWMLVTSIRPTRFSITYPPNLLPEELRWSAYVELFQTIPIATWLRNTTIVSLGTTAVCLVLSVLGAYSISSFRWRGRGLFGFALLVTQMLPEALLIIPIFIIFRQLNLLDSLQGLVISDSAFVVPITVWVLKGFFDTLPTEVAEAAMVDGCSRMGVLWRIMIPLSMPALVAVSVVAFFEGWNEYLFASTFITTSELRVASIGLASFIGELATPVELVLAAATVFTVAPVVFYLLMQRYIVAGLTGGAVKG
ncbi:MAG: carbohydrate ABC transporter permease [Chloroflexota bacterium]